MGRKLKGYETLEELAAEIKSHGFKFDQLKFINNSDSQEHQPHRLNFITPENFTIHKTTDGKISLMLNHESSKFLVIGYIKNQFVVQA